MVALATAVPFPPLPQGSLSRWICSPPSHLESLELLFLSPPCPLSFYPPNSWGGTLSSGWLCPPAPSLLHPSLQHPIAAALCPLGWLDEAFRHQGPFSPLLLHPSRASDAGDLFWSLDLRYFFDSHLLGHTSSVARTCVHAPRAPSSLFPLLCLLLWVFSFEGLGNRPHADQAQHPSLSCPELF